MSGTVMQMLSYCQKDSVYLPLGESLFNLCTFLIILAIIAFALVLIVKGLILLVKGAQTIWRKKFATHPLSFNKRK